jgi:hypothetical protein
VAPGTFKISGDIRLPVMPKNQPLVSRDRQTQEAFQVTLEVTPFATESD